MVHRISPRPGRLVGDPLIGFDSDAGQTERLLFSMYDQTQYENDQQEYFTINSKGQIAIENLFANFEFKSSYTLTIKVTDDGLQSDGFTPLECDDTSFGCKLEGLGSLLVKINDINEEPILYDETRYVEEHSPVDALVGPRIKSSDPDINDEILTEIVGGNSDRIFRLESCSGQISLVKNVLDFEKRHIYELDIRVSDKAKLSMVGKIIVEVLDVNEMPSIRGAEFSVVENLPSGTVVGPVLVADDVDYGHNSRLQFSVAGGNDGDVFGVETYAGQLFIARGGPNHINYEGRPVEKDGSRSPYTLQVTASDPGLMPSQPYKEVEEAVLSHITVHTGCFRKESLNFADMEGNYKFSSELSLPLSRREFRLQRCAEVAFLSGQEFFGLSDGACSIGNSPNASEASYSCKSGYGSLESSDVYHITVSPVVIEVNSAEKCKKLCEQQQHFCKAFMMKNGGTECRIVPLTHEALNMPRPVSYNTGYTSYIKNVFQTKLSASASVTIHLIDVNEAPRFNGGIRYIEENSPEERAIGKPFQAPDDDFDVVKFSMEGWFDGGDFWGTEANGGEYLGYRTFTIMERSCLFWNESSYKNEIDERGNHNKCRNPDKSITGPWCFVAKDERESCFIYHKGSNDNIQMLPHGQLQVRKNSLNFEEMSSYILIISTVDDNKAGSLITTKAVHVQIVDVNENPVINNQYRECKESHLVGMAIGEPIITFDIDAGQTVSVKITGGDPLFKLSIDDSNLLMPTQALDFETRNEYELEVVAVDTGKGALTDNAKITVVIHNVNEAPYFPTTESYERYILENSRSGTKVPGAINGADPDQGDENILTYSILGAIRMDDPAANDLHFSVNQDTGVITITDDSLDFEDCIGWHITVQVSDNEFNANVLVAMNVLDVNEPPEMNVTTSGMSLNENFQMGDKVGTPIKAIDVDGDSVAFSIVGGDKDGLFTIDSDGQIFVAKGPSPNHVAQIVNNHSLGCRNCHCLVDATGKTCADCNSSAPGYIAGTGCYKCPQHTLRRDGKCISNDWLTHGKVSITVQVTDDGSSRNGGTENLFIRKQFSLTITPANDPPSLQSLTFSIPENSKENAVVGQLHATDPENHGLTYRILKGNQDNAFFLNNITGQLMLNSMNANNFEMYPVFYLQIEAMDDGEGNMTDVALITVNLIDVNEPPQIENALREVEENCVPNETVGVPLDAYDVDEGDVLHFSIIGGNEDAMFKINSATGQIRSSTDGLNYELKPEYDLKIRITDKAGLYNDATILIFLVDMNDSPQIHITSSRTITENAKPGTLVGTAVVASDEDALDALTFGISSGNCQSFGIAKNEYHEVEGRHLGTISTDITFELKGEGSLILANSNRNRFNGETFFRFRNVENMNICIHYGWPIEGLLTDPTDLNAGRTVRTWFCGEAFGENQVWIHTKKDSKIRLASFPDYCLHVWNADEGLSDGQKVGLWKCESKYLDHQSFSIEDQTICLNKDIHYCVSTKDTLVAGNAISMQRRHTKSYLANWITVVATTPVSDQRYVLSFGEKVGVKKCFPRNNNLVSNANDWYDPQSVGYGIGWEITGKGLQQVAVKTADSCGISEIFKGPYQHVSTSESATLTMKRRHLLIRVRAEGCDDLHKHGVCGKASIYLNENQVGTKSRGINVAVFDPSTEQVETRSFDTSTNADDVRALGLSAKVTERIYSCYCIPRGSVCTILLPTIQPSRI